MTSPQHSLLNSMKSYRIGSVPDWIVAELAAREVQLGELPRVAALPEDARLVILGGPTVGAISAAAAAAPLAVVIACYGPDELIAAADAADSDADDVVLEPTPPAARAARVALMLRHLCGRWAEATVARHAAPSMVFRAAADTGTIEVVSDPRRRLDLTRAGARAALARPGAPRRSRRGRAPRRGGDRRRAPDLRPPRGRSPWRARDGRADH